MAILVSGEYLDPIPAPRPTACFYCDGELPAGWPLVYWFADHLIVLHPACAAVLGAHLIADSREAELAAGAEPHWNRRAARAVRAALRASEMRP